ncbi:MAG: hypothetical protein M1339_05130 [Bacteroidetes bacterium]|nr:hypothetical protein [Bacteroidota bacterium]
MNIKKIDVVRGRAIIDPRFREQLLSNPTGVAGEYGVTEQEILDLLTDLSPEDLEKYHSLALQRLEESAEYQKAL